MAGIVLVADQNVNVTLKADKNDLNHNYSESSVAVDPEAAPLHLAVAVRVFVGVTDPDYESSTVAVYDFIEGRKIWTKTGWEDRPWIQLPPPVRPTTIPGFLRRSDPTVAFDSNRTLYLATVAVSSTPSADRVLIYRYDETRKEWFQELSDNQGVPGLQGGDGSTIACDWQSPHAPSVYAVWLRSGNTVLFARKAFPTSNWKGAGSMDPGSYLGSGEKNSNPSIAVAADGAVYVCWARDSSIEFVKSTDGGNSFSNPKTIDGNVSTLGTGAGGLLPGGKVRGTFRVDTFATIAAGDDGNVIVAWADWRDGSSRIYFQRSTDGGSSWMLDANTQRPTGRHLLSDDLGLFPQILRNPDSNQHDFHPRLASFRGEIGCTFYRFGPKGGMRPEIDVMFASSLDGGASVWSVTTVTDGPWDPAVAFGASTTNPVKFIGDYFGLVGSNAGFHPVWTDTRRLAQKPTDEQQKLFTTTVDRQPYLPVPWRAILNLIEHAGRGWRLVPQGLAPMEPLGTEDPFREERGHRARHAFIKLAESIRVLLRLDREVTQHRDTLMELFPEAWESLGEEGRLLGVRSALRCVLDARGLTPTAAEDTAVEMCNDLATLERWLKRAATMASAAEALR